MWFVIIIGVALLFALWSLDDDIKGSRIEKLVLFCDDCGDPYFHNAGCRQCRGDAGANMLGN